MTNRTAPKRVVPTKDGVVGVFHPGQYVRDTVLLPKKLSVKSAAQLLGVGVPAFSNFLNGRSSTTPDMASRIERSFGVSATELLKMQAAYDAAEAKAKGAPANAIPYVVPFLGIKARDIESWVDRNIDSRTKLAVLLRMLVNSTGLGLSKVDFPGHDDAQRNGWDGVIEAAQATPWIPEGASGWEFGTTNEDIKKKADSDFAKSVKAVDKESRERTTFVFVTPWHWPGKTKWLAEKAAKGQWKEVRAYDSSDLEQWLEQSLPVQAWFNSEADRPTKGVRSLDWVWADWAQVSDPPLSCALFSTAVRDHKDDVADRLKAPPKGPIVVAADSADEGLAFLAELFRCEELVEHRDRVLVFKEKGVLPKLAAGTRKFIAVTANPEVDRELGPFAQTIHGIVVRPRNATNEGSRFELETLDVETFRTGLEKMGFGREAIEKYENESGRSLTVLRRRLAPEGSALRTPEWAADAATAEKLIPFLFAGAWNSVNNADRGALTQFADGRSYEKLDGDCQRLTLLEDPPLWSVGSYRGAVSKIDLLFAISTAVTEGHLKRFFEAARTILGEDDPKLDLPDNERWAAAMHGKSRDYSVAMREGVRETLVLLAVHGKALFGKRMGLDCAVEANRLVKDMLTPLDGRRLEAQERDLPAYAEAAPETLLSILEEDIKEPQSALRGLMRPIGDITFGGCSRTGLLWALEGLAWNPASLPRVAEILTSLSEIEIDDNLANKPIRSLKSIFDARMPQTAADHQTRVGVIKLLVRKSPEVAWKLCVSQLNRGHWTGHYNHKPRWRNDGYGHGEPHKTWGPIVEFQREMADLVIAWNDGHTKEMLCDLIQHLHDLDDAHQVKVWELIAAWAASAPDNDKAFVREKIRVTILSRRAARHSPKSRLPKLSHPAKAAYAALEPSDLLSRHEWLFRQHWLEESADDLQDDEFDFHQRDARVRGLRIDALREVFVTRGASGVFDLAEMGNSPHLIGHLMASDILPRDQLASFMLAALPPASNRESAKRAALLQGALSGVNDQKGRFEILKKAKRELAGADFTRLLLLAPFRRDTWRLVDKLAESDRLAYWREIAPDWIRGAEDETNEAVERLLAARRPRAAFACAHIELEALEAGLLFRLMSAVVKGGDDLPGFHLLDPYYIKAALRILDRSPTLTLEEKAGLELAFIDALSDPWGEEDKTSGIPNLERYIEQHPGFLARAVAWAYKRKDGDEDPSEWRVPPDQVQQFAERGDKLLRTLRRTPGFDERGELHIEILSAWVKSARAACADLGRSEAGDNCVGNLLSHAPIGEDGAWPCGPVRDVIEDARSKAMVEGMFIGVLNARGVVWRQKGGAQERELAEKYRRWAHALEFTHPFVSHALLKALTDFYEREATREDVENGISRRLS